MYKRDKSLILKASTSAVCNNLSLFMSKEKSSINYAVVHKSLVSLLTSTVDGGTATHRQVSCKDPSANNVSSSIIMQARWVVMSHRTILVITSQKGIQMFEGDISVMLYWYALNCDGLPDGTATFARGICGLQDNSVCVGTFHGNILVFNVPDKGTNVTVNEVLKAHGTAVCDLHAQDDRFVSSDDDGNICVWKMAGKKCQQLVSIPGSKSPCSSIILWHDVIIGGYGSGHIRLFNATTGKMSCEVTAHARWVTAIDVSESTGLLLSVSEDSFLRVWQVVEGKYPELEHKFSESVTDIQLAGGSFVQDEGKAICVTGYDCNELIFYVGTKSS